jgi:DNA helicase-4
MKLSVRALEAYASELRQLFERETYISHLELKDVIVRHASSRSLPKIFWWHMIAICLRLGLSSTRNAFRLRGVITHLSSESTRAQHNNFVISEAQTSGMLIEEKSLDAQQIEAVVASEDAQLIMAAAGSGKTLSLLAKCKYLIETVGVPAHKILTISFTKKSADELAERLDHLGLSVQAQTFHALGKRTLDNGNTKVLSETRQKNRLKMIIDQLLDDNDAFAREYNDYMLYYFAFPIGLSELNSLKEIVAFNKSFLTQTLQSISLKKRNYSMSNPTIKGEFVRSKEEQIIANYLYVNNISYVYEQQYPGTNGKYKPDFTITQFKEPIYLEHQGIDREGRTRPDIDPEKYYQKMTWSRQCHADNGTRLVQSYSYEFTEGTVLTNLEANLKSHGIQIVRKQESEINQLIRDGYKSDITKFQELLLTFLNLYKTSDQTIETLNARVQKLSSYQRKRASKFLDMFWKIEMAYEQHMDIESEIDFADMITLAAETLPSLPSGLMNYDYILVDEVQDLSSARYRLLKALLDRNPSAKLFAVGDDWQSIFRFAGSDATLLRDFEKKFERVTRHSVIEQTHRFNNPLLSLSSGFVQKNPQQKRKTLRSSANHFTPLTLNDSATSDSDCWALDEEIKKLADQYGDALANQSIIVMARYNYDIERLEALTDKLDWLSATASSPFLLQDKKNGVICWRDKRTGNTTEIKFITMHKAKGLTCNYAYIINANGGMRGMPSERSDDPVIKLLLAHSDSYPNAEERRLFYVALTRATQMTTVIATRGNVSPFVEEIMPQSESSIQHCPRCASGVISFKTGMYGEFTACSNFQFGCTYTPRDGKELGYVSSRSSAVN